MLQDAYLLELRHHKGVVEGLSLPTCEKHPKISLWQGDITRLKVDAIVNAAKRLQEHHADTWLLL